VTATPSGAARSAGRRRQAGFTLAEILLVVAIVATLAAIGAPVYLQALDAAKVSRAIADIRAISRDIESTRLTTGAPPDTLSQAGYGAHTDPYGRPYQYLRIDNLKGKGAVRKDRKLNPLNSDFDLYSMGKDGQTQVQVSNKDSLDDIIRASDGGFVGLARDF
jgi:general secretion pathway protein G